MCTEPHTVYPRANQLSDREGPWPQRASELGHCIALVGTVYLLLAAAAWCRFLPYVGAGFSAAAMLSQLWAPMARADAAHESTRRLGLTWLMGRGERAMVLLGVFALLPAWALCVWGFRAHMGLLFNAARGAGHPLWQGGWPAVEWAMSQYLGIALPEELFWRGYVQPVLASRLGISASAMLPRGAIAANALFAVGHVVGGAPLWALGTFFPGLLFAVMRHRFGSIAGAVILHGTFNVASAWLLHAFAAIA